MNPSQKNTLFWLLFALVIGGIIVAVFVFSSGGSSPITANGDIKLLVPVSASDHTVGTSTAPVTIVEYADFECPACQQYAPVVNQLLKDEPGKIFFVYRYFPLPQHPNAIPSAEAAEAAGLQGKFWDMHDLLYANHDEWETLSDPSPIFLKYAQQIGLDTAKFTKDAASSAVADKVKSSYAEASNNQLTYTPTFFLNGVRITNPAGLDAFKKVIDAEASSTPQ